jgi:hypothetical protein
MKTTVCYIITSDNPSSIFTFDNANYQLKERESEFEEAPKEFYHSLGETEVDILVGIYSDVCDSVADYFKKKAKEIITIPSNYTTAEAYNILFKKCYNKYVCVLPNNSFLHRTWLSELVFYAENIPNTGFVGIPNSVLGCEYSPMVTHDLESFLNVFKPKSLTIDTNLPFLFTTKLLFELGGLKEDKEINGYEFYHYQLRVIYYGLTNYYISNISGVSLPVMVKNFDNAKYKAEKSVEQMRKDKSLYISF